MGSRILSSQSGASTQSASVTATTSCAAARMATFRPLAMLAPASERAVTSAACWSLSNVPSVDPPSTTMTSSGARVWARTESRNSSMCGRASLTVATRETFMIGMVAAAAPTLVSGDRLVDLERAAGGRLQRELPHQGLVAPAHRPGKDQAVRGATACHSAVRPDQAHDVLPRLERPDEQHVRRSDLEPGERLFDVAAR